MVRMAVLRRAPKGIDLTSFDTLGLSSQTLKTLPSLGFEQPTPIQAQAIPLVLAGHDLIGLAQTGTGKTAAFGLPLAEQLLADGGRPAPRKVRALILAPTRELVNQISTNLKSFVKRTPLTVGTVVGGASINLQTKMLARGLDVLVATPGRLLDLIDRKALFLDAATRLVLDEADQMLDLGFIHDLKRIVKLVPAKRQTLLFSATMPKQIADLAAAFLTDPKKVAVTPPGKAADRIAQSVHFVADRNDKTALLSRSLADSPDALSLVFARTKHGAEKLMKQLKQAGFESASIHGNKSQGQRERALKAFRTGETRVLVATDVAARGIDVPGVTHVYNFDLPEVPDAYVHRIGRTARAGAAGKAVAFCAPDEIRLLRDIERLMGLSVEVASGAVPQDQARPPRGRGDASRSQRGNRPAGNGKPTAGRGPRRDGRQGAMPRNPEFGALIAQMNDTGGSGEGGRPRNGADGADAGKRNRPPRRKGANGPQAAGAEGHRHKRGGKPGKRPGQGSGQHHNGGGRLAARRTPQPGLKPSAGLP